MKIHEGTQVLKPKNTACFLREHAYRYVESCHLEDGGYSFIRIMPSSVLDTYYALASLAFLGFKPKLVRTTVRFLCNQLRDDSYINLSGIWMTMEAMFELNCINKDARNSGLKVINFQNKNGGFGTLENLYVEVTSELEATYRALRVLKISRATIDQPGIAKFVAGFHNADGSYGRGLSALASTYYATAIYHLLDLSMDDQYLTIDYLRQQEVDCQERLTAGSTIFLEQLFWLIRALANLRLKTIDGDSITAYVRACQRPGGGFARAAPIGIPTLEHTFYALAILKESGAI